MPREDIGLTPDEVRAFLAGAADAVLVTAGDTHPGGEVVPVWWHGDTSRLVALPSPVATAAIAADPRVCLIVERQPDYAGILGVLVHGEAVRIEGGRVSVGLDDVVSFDFGRLRVNRPPGP